MTPAKAVTAKPNGSNDATVPPGVGFRAELTIPTTAASAVFSVRKNVFVPARRADKRSAISTAVLYISKIVLVSSPATASHCRYQIFCHQGRTSVMRRRFSHVQFSMVSNKDVPLGR